MSRTTLSEIDGMCITQDQADAMDEVCEYAACQQRAPFAPGVIERHTKPRKNTALGLLLIVLPWIVIGAGIAGYLWGGK